MVNRKDELSNTDIDQGWPRQVALPAETTLGENYFTVYGFCKDLTLCPKGTYFVAQIGGSLCSASPSAKMRMSFG